MEGVRSPAQVFALVIGATLTVAGIVGFFYNASFATGDGTARDAVLGVLDVNGWHNLFHIASGGIGLVVAGSYGGSRAYALGLGALYLLVALLGFLAGDGDEIVNLIPVTSRPRQCVARSGAASARLSTRPIGSALATAT